METNLNSWFHHQLSRHQSSYINSLSSPFNLVRLNDAPRMSPCARISSPNGTLTEFAFSGVPYPMQWQSNESQDLFYGLPHYHQGLNDMANTISHAKAPYFSGENHEETNIANARSRPAQKRFLVFDQSGDQTTLFYTPGTGPHVQLTPEVPKPESKFCTNNMVKTDIFQQQEPILTSAYNGKQRDDTESEMHEDTEELNALLYSDDEYSEDEEEASTGHSPSTLTNCDKECGRDKEVASNFGPSKRIRLLNGGFAVSPLVESASSAGQKFSFECEDDAGSSCGDEENLELDDSGMLGGTKRSRKDGRREMLSLLQRIIPGEKSKDKDPILIFDKAINYLKSLKVEAQALGVHTI